jgi:corrinoid protein of di/trimethylamine methyltransferase
MTRKERILMAARGEMPDVLPYVPRFDLWYNANSYAGTLPEIHRGRTADEIGRAEGWALHKVVPELLQVEKEEENLNRAIGLYGLKENGYRITFSPNVEIRVERTPDSVRVEYHTPVGVVSTREVITEEMRRAGASITWIDERAIKGVKDYETLAYLFEQVTVVPDYDRYARWQAAVGDDGVACMMGSFAASPMQHIQRDFLEATGFFLEYNDHQREMRRLAESLEGVYDQLLRVVCESPAEVILWGANYDDMITYPPYFEKEILPWLRKASTAMAAKGKLLICHCDGENLGLLDLIRDSGMHIAEAICPHPMTKVRIEEYYRRWGDRLTIFGGIPQSLLLAETASEEDFEAYLDHFFKAVAPGRRLIVGIADTTPPNAVFDRLRRLGERVEREGRLPLQAGAFRVPVEARAGGGAAAKALAAADETFQAVQKAVLQGDHLGIGDQVHALLERGIPAGEILQRGMISAMEVIGERFKSGDVFIPEVLLSARAMNEALGVLEPHLAGDRMKGGGKILIGTVRGDLHDIGKNMVATMLRGVGFEIRDLGINIRMEDFVEQVAAYKPDILGLSALLTTTMPEMGRVIQALKARGLRDGVKVMVGGAPVNEKFARDIGADAYAADAGDAVAAARRLMSSEASAP